MRHIVRLALAGLALAAFSGTAVAQDTAGDPKNGEKVFRKCKVCHMVGEDAKKRVGPVLNDIIGRKAGSWDDFNYSKAMKEAGEKGLTWTEENLHKYLENPREFIPGNKMAFVGLKKDSDRNDVIAYLKQFSKDTAGK